MQEGGIQKFSLDRLSAVKNDVPWKWGVGVCEICGADKKNFFLVI